MSVAEKTAPGGRWHRTLYTADTLADDLAGIGTWVGPCAGPHRRSQGEKEDFVLLRLLVAWKKENKLDFPVAVFAETDTEGEPDFTLSWNDGRSLGVEVSEAGKEDYQAWLTATAGESGAKLAPFEPSTPEAAEEIRKAIEKKVTKYNSESYRRPDACDLLIYDNSAHGAFVDKRQVLDALGLPNDLMGRFRQIHLFSAATVYLDIFGDRRIVGISNAYEVDYAEWIFDQVERLRRGQIDRLELTNIAEEMADLGRSERRTVASHLKNLLLHLLKWQFQPERRGRSWRVSIYNARSGIYERLTESPSLRSWLWDQVARQYDHARGAAAIETELPLDTFPETCPYQPEQLVNSEFMPGPEDAERDD